MSNFYIFVITSAFNSNTRTEVSDDTLLKIIIIEDRDYERFYRIEEGKGSYRLDKWTIFLP